MTTLFLGTPLLSYDGKRPFVFSKSGFPLSTNFYVWGVYARQLFRALNFPAYARKNYATVDIHLKL